MSIDVVLRSRNVDGLKGLNIGARGARSTRTIIRLHTIVRQRKCLVIDSIRKGAAIMYRDQDKDMMSRANSIPL